MQQLLPPTDTTYGIKYLGSKKEILSDIWQIIAGLDIKTAIDVFSGTTRVAQYLRKRGIVMTTSDISWATTCYAHTYVHNRDNFHLAAYVEQMNLLKPVHGWLSQNYAGEVPQDADLGMGRCFQLKNTQMADAARDWLETIDVEPWEKMTLITSIINALDHVDNTVGMQQAYLKSWCQRSYHDIIFNKPMCISGPTGTHIEGNCLTNNYESADLAYIDPPYSAHSYAAYYHIWDSIARWDKPETSLTNKRRADRVTKHAAYDTTLESPWNRSNLAIQAFDDLIARLPTRYVLISYNNESIVSEPELLDVCWRYGHVTSRKIIYSRNIMSQIGNGGTDSKPNQTNYELLYLIDKNLS